MKKYGLEILLIIAFIVASGLGVYNTRIFELEPVTNVYGDVVQLFGRGIYAYESLFQGPIFVGTDFVILHVVIPLFILFLIKADLTKQSHVLIKLGFLTVFIYYSINLAFGLMMNRLFLVYIIAFSTSFFLLIQTVRIINFEQLTMQISMGKMPKFLVGFLIIAGLSVSVWFFEIFELFHSGRPSEIIGMKTTEPTFILDLALIGPLCFIAAYNVRRGKAIGYVIGFMMLSLLAAIGLIVITQTATQYYFGVTISIQEFTVYVGIFILLSSIAFNYLRVLMKGVLR
jgi:hypothetical protein